MATFNYILGRKKDDGTYPIYLKICNGKSNTMRSMDISVAKSEWNTKGQRIRIRQADTYDVRQEKEKSNDFLEALMNRSKEVERILKKQGILGEMSAKKLCDAIWDYSPNSKRNEGNGSGSFVEYWNTIAMQTPKSQEKYIYALKTLVNYHISCTGRDEIQFADVSVDWIRGYLSYIQKGAYQFSRGRNILNTKSLSAWTVNSYASCLKKVINCAIDANRLSADVLRGFRNFKAGVVHEEPYTLSMDELKELLNYPFPTMRQRLVRDLFIFSFCSMGMNLTDIYQMSKKAIKWGDDACEIKYKRSKTGKQIVVIINSNATRLRELITPYCSSNRNNVWRTHIDSNMYFGLDYNYLTYKTFSGNFQKVIREIRSIMGYDEEFTFYTARDSWATILSAEYQLGQEYVDTGLGHSTKSLAGNHYIAIDYDKLYEAHTDMIQRLFEEESEE